MLLLSIVGCVHNCNAGRSIEAFPEERPKTLKKRYATYTQSVGDARQKTLAIPKRSAGSIS